MDIVGITRHVVGRLGASVLVVGLFVVVATASPAAASGDISVDPSTAAPGDTVTIAGTVPTDGCPSGDGAQLTSTDVLFPPDGFGPQAPRDANGKFSIQFAIPATTPPGSYSIGVRCGGGNVGISAGLTVAAPAPAPTTTTTTTPKTTTSTTSTTSTTTSTTIASSLSGSSAASTKSSNSALPWILLVIAAIVAAASATYFVRSRRSP